MSTSFGSWNWSSPRQPPSSNWLRSSCRIICQGNLTLCLQALVLKVMRPLLSRWYYFLWRGTFQRFCLSSQVELTVLPSAGQREKEERDATYQMKVCTRSICDGGIFTFEKTTAHFVRPGCEVALDLSSDPGHHLRVCRAALGEGDGLPRLLPRLQRPERDGANWKDLSPRCKL